MGWQLALSVLALCGCGSAAAADGALDGALDDAGPIADAALGTDGAAAEDASSTRGDAADDAEGGDGASALPSCEANGVLGVCKSTSDCASPYHSVAGHCPGPASEECCILELSDADPFATTDASGWCPTDPTARPNEGLVEAPGDPGCPSGMIKITSFCIDKYEAEIMVTNPDGSESSWSPYYPPPSGTPYRAVSLEGAVPQGYISGEESQIACTAAGKRLCTSEEWLRACQGPSGFTYPYGNTREPGVCNDHRDVHPAIQCFDSSATWVFSEIDWPGINQQADTVDRTGSRVGCVTVEGAYDMMGNLHEWIDGDPGVDPKPLSAPDFRGGYYVDTVENGNGCLYVTSAHDFYHWDYSTGFRCCADPK
jgi:sulfatase modifying factor 1